MNTRLFLGTLVVAVLFAGVTAPVVSNALTVEDLQSQVQALLAKVAELTRQIERLGGVVVTDPSLVVSVSPFKHRICNVVTRNLGVGAQGEDVRGLQEFLYEQTYLPVAPTGYFGQLTAEAVRRWQASEGVHAIGAFGPMSRERLKVWCGGFVNKERFSASPTRGDAPLTVTFNTWLSGFRPHSIYYTIDFGDGTNERAADCSAPADWCQSPGQNKHTYSSNGTYTATLNKITSFCGDANPGPGIPPCMAPIQTEIVAKAQINVGPFACTKEYKPVCGAQPIVCITTPCNPIPTTYGNRCEMNANGATFLYEGQCRSDYRNPADDPRCKAWYDGCNSCSRNAPGASEIACTTRLCPVPMDLNYQGPRPAAYCTAWFDSAGNKPPTISGFSGPTTLAVNATGTWTIKASDPENGQLSYSVSWGDVNMVISTTGSPASAARDFVQSTTFTHAYTEAGTYVVTILVRDSAGREAQTATTVKVGSDSVCTGEHAPVCAQPLAHGCVPGAQCPAIIPKTYSNRCLMNAAHASFLYVGECEVYTACTADAYQCPNGQWVGRTGPNCQFVCPN